MKYASLRAQMKVRIEDLKEALSSAIDDNNTHLVDELTEQIEATEWQIECLEDQMFYDYSNY